MRLLVVDDDVTVRMLLSMALDDVDVVERWRATGIVQQATEVAPDALILDRRLPDGDGLDAVRALRADRRTADLPIVVITADDDPVQRQQAFAVGADEHMPKPVSPEELLALVSRIVATPVAQRRTRRAVHRARFHVGRPDGGLDDLTVTALPVVAVEPRRRRRLLSRS